MHASDASPVYLNPPISVWQESTVDLWFDFCVAIYCKCEIECVTINTNDYTLMIYMVLGKNSKGVLKSHSISSPDSHGGYHVGNYRKFNLYRFLFIGLFSMKRYLQHNK